MSELAFVLPPFTAGLLLGAFFFGGLWWTVTRGMSSPRPFLWFLGSLLLRMSFTMAGFYFVSGDHWARWVLCLAGFMVARLLIKVFTRPKAQSAHAQALGSPYAP